MLRHRAYLGLLSLVLGASALACADRALGTSEELAVTRAALTDTDALVISQIYGGGGNSGATYSWDYVELFNRGTTPVSLGGASIQYGSAAGAFGGVVALPAVDVPAGGWFLIQLAGGANTPAELPVTADLKVTTTNLAAANGKVVLSSGATALACGQAGSPCSGTAGVVDLVGWGTASDYEGTAVAAVSGNAKALVRGTFGCMDTNDNAADFTVVTPGALHNSASTPIDCADAGTPDAGDDAGEDAGDAGVDASDAGRDAAPDTGAVDAGVDARADAASRDAGGAVRPGSNDDWVPQPDTPVADSCAFAVDRRDGIPAAALLAVGALVLGARRRRR